MLGKCEAWRNKKIRNKEQEIKNKKGIEHVVTFIPLYFLVSYSLFIIPMNHLDAQCLLANRIYCCQS
jgi:hypothetical protein